MYTAKTDYQASLTAAQAFVQLALSALGPAGATATTLEVSDIIDDLTDIEERLSGLANPNETEEE